MVLLPTLLPELWGPPSVTGWVRIQLVDVIKTRLISILMRATNAASRGVHRALAIPQSFLRTRSSTPSDANPASLLRRTLGLPQQSVRCRIRKIVAVLDFPLANSTFKSPRQPLADISRFVLEFRTASHSLCVATPCCVFSPKLGGGQTQNAYGAILVTHSASCKRGPGGGPCSIPTDGGGEQQQQRRAACCGRTAGQSAPALQGQTAQQQQQQQQQGRAPENGGAP